jgi:hypothetical protein
VVVDGYKVDPQDLYTHYEDVFGAASNLRQSGVTALMMITQLSSGLNPGGIHELETLQRNHMTALGDAQSVVSDSVSGLGFLAQGAGLIGTSYQATDGAAADKINGTLVDKLFAPPPPGQQQQGPPPEPLTPEEQQRLQNIANTLAGRGTTAGGATRVMNTANGSVRVTVPGIAPLVPPPLPGQKPGTTAPPPAAPPPAPPPAEYTTGREDDLDPDRPAQCFFPDDGKPHTCEGWYDDKVYRTRPPTLPQLDTD